MGYVYAALWFIIAVLLIGRFRKESKVVYPLSLYFFILGFWWIADEFTSADLMHGSYAWILRGISAAALGLAGFVYFREKNKNLKAEENSEDDTKK